MKKWIAILLPALAFLIFFPAMVNAEFVESALSLTEKPSAPMRRPIADICVALLQSTHLERDGS